MTRFRVLIVALLVGAATSSLPASATVAADVTIVSPSSLGAAQHGPPRMNESAQYTSTVPLEPHQPDRRAHKPRKRRPKFPELLCPRSALNSLSGEHGGSTDVPGEGVDESPAVAPGSSEFWWHIGIIMGLLLVAALMVFTVFVKGLTIGLISLDPTTLRILKKSGDERQREYARIVLPLRMRGHLLLCTLLIANMLANEALPIILDNLVSKGWQAVVLSTALIVLFGEIIPQAFCARYGLAIGARTAPLVKFVIVLLYPLAWPISKVLTWMLGDHEGTSYRRAELKELISLHTKEELGELEADEINIIRSVLDVQMKTAATIMTPMKAVFMLDFAQALDEDLLRAIVASGFSRIPIFRGDRSHVVGVLLVKRLLVLNLNEQAVTVGDIMPAVSAPFLVVSAAVPLFKILDQFKRGHCSGHLAFVSNEAHTTLQVQTYLVDQGTPYGFLGVITLEDIIEELIGEEIADETDVHQRPPSSPHYSIDVDGFKVNTDFGIVDESSGDSLNFGGERATLHSSVRSVNVRSANSVAPDSPLMSSSRSVGDYESKPLLPSSRK